MAAPKRVRGRFQTVGLLGLSQRGAYSVTALLLFTPLKSRHGLLPQPFVDRLLGACSIVDDVGGLDPLTTSVVLLEMDPLAVHSGV